MRHPPRALIGLWLLVGSVLAGCGDPKPSSPTPADLAQIDFTPDHTITVDDQGFHPATLVVLAGDVLLLVNAGSALHSFTADSRFDTGRMHPGDETTMVLSAPGKIPYFDLEDPDHTATIIVEQPPDGG
ncbi:MAG: hypothetical protein WD691_10535 [Acidimicrobiales bacterium]